MIFSEIVIYLLSKSPMEFASEEAVVADAPLVPPVTVSPLPNVVVVFA